VWGPLASLPDCAYDQYLATAIKEYIDLIKKEEVPKN
jgi:hypothetical protein